MVSILLPHAGLESLTFNHSGAVRLSFRAQPVRATDVCICHAGQKPPVQSPLLIELVVQQRLLPIVILHLLQESREAGDPGRVSVRVMIGVVGAEQVFAAGAAAAADAGEPRTGAAVVGAEEGRDSRRSAVVRREALGKDGRLQVAQEQGVMVQMVEGGVCHGENTVAFTWKEIKREMKGKKRI